MCRPPSPTASRTLCAQRRRLSSSAFGCPCPPDVARERSTIERTYLLSADPAALPSAHAVVLAAPHAAYLRDADRHVFGALVDSGVVVDVKARLGVDARVWAL